MSFLTGGRYIHFIFNIKLIAAIHVNKKICTGVKSLVKDRVVHTGKSKDLNHLILIRNNKEDKEYEPQYTVLRVMKANINSALNRHREKHKKMKQLLDINYNPNTIILWKCIKNKLIKSKKIIKSKKYNSGMNFNLSDGFSQSDLIDVF